MYSALSLLPTDPVPAPLRSEESEQPMLRRSDHSLIDQFSHIQLCLYRFHEGKWQKDGLEVAYFLFERAASCHPENEIKAAEGNTDVSLVSRFTAERLAMAKRSPNRSPRAGRPPTTVRDPPTIRSPNSAISSIKSRTRVCPRPMFWYLDFNSEQYKPLSDTIERLMSVIRKGEPYPYNLDRPLPRVGHPTSTDVRSQDASVTSPVDASSATLPQQSSANQPLTTATSGTVSDLDKLVSKAILSASPAPTPNNSKVALETLLASASASTSSAPTSNLVSPSHTTTKGVPSSILSLLPPHLHLLPCADTSPTPSRELGAVPPTSVWTPVRTSRVCPATSAQRYISEPKSSEPTSPTHHAAAQMIHSLQPTTSQLPLILTQDVISVTRAASRHHSGDARVMWSAALVRMGERPQPH